MIVVRISLSKNTVFKNVSRPLENETLRFRDGLVWTISITVERKLRFQIPAASRSVNSALIPIW